LEKRGRKEGIRGRREIERGVKIKRGEWKIEPTMAKKGKKKRLETVRQQSNVWERSRWYLQWSRSIWKASDGKRRCKKSASIIVNIKNQSKDFP
jgi:hypothetical protein